MTERDRIMYLSFIIALFRIHCKSALQIRNKDKEHTLLYNRHNIPTQPYKYSQQVHAVRSVGWTFFVEQNIAKLVIKWKLDN